MQFTILKELFQKLISYCSKEVIKEAFLKALEAFKDTLWKEIKEEVHNVAKEVISEAEAFLTSVEAQEKEEAILNAIMEKIQLPFILKPFKGIIRNIIKGKLEAFVEETLNKGKDLLA